MLVPFVAGSRGSMRITLTELRRSVIFCSKKETNYDLQF
jgi:hypothetical protein